MNTMIESLSNETISDLLVGVEKPARYIGGEVNSIRKTTAVRARIALGFPDVYEVAESHIGLKILYDVVNRESAFAAERVYALWPDLEEKARAAQVPLWTLESRLPLSACDLVGFTLQYELSYPTILAMLEHGGIPLRSYERGLTDPVVIAGGAGAYNPEPIAPFIDAFLLGDGEEAIVEMMSVVACARERQASRATLLDELSRLPGVYVPSHFEITYTGIDIATIEARANSPYASAISKHGLPRVGRRTIADLDSAPYPSRPIIPNVKPVHDRVAIEIQRGCSQGCRFCQAGMITRPTRQRKPETVLKLAQEQLASTGCDQVSLLSLSAGDYEPINSVLTEFFERYEGERIAVSLPSMRTETMTPQLAEQVARVRKSGFTFAPEAGSERLRRVINKTNSEEDLLKAVRSTITAGWLRLKFYFMMGLPTETDADLDAIVQLAFRAREEGRKINRAANVTVSVSTFVPKPHTSFQWERQISVDETLKKHRRLREQLRSLKIEFRWHSPQQSYLEGILSRGDRRLAAAIEKAAALGCRLDGWAEHHQGAVWLEVLREELEPYGLVPDDYLKERNEKAPLPWDHLDAGILKKFLLRDRKASLREKTIEDCALEEHCYACGGCDLGDPYNIRNAAGDRPINLRPIVRRDDLSLDRILPAADTKRLVSDETPRRVRFRFAKVGVAVHISHLDVMEHLLRALRLARVPLTFSQGFNPRPKVAFSPACPTGIESEAEYFDVNCASLPDLRDTAERINTLLPDGLSILDVDEIDWKAPAFSQLLSTTTYLIKYPQSVNASRLREEVENFLASDHRPVRVIRKKRERILDARAYISEAAVVGNLLQLTVSFNGGFGTVRIVEAIALFIGISAAQASQVRKVRADLFPDFQGPIAAQDSIELTTEPVDLRGVFTDRGKTTTIRPKAIKLGPASVPYAE